MSKLISTLFIFISTFLNMFYRTKHSVTSILPYRVSLHRNRWKYEIVMYPDSNSLWLTLYSLRAEAEFIANHFHAIPECELYFQKPLWYSGHGSFINDDHKFNFLSKRRFVHAQIFISGLYFRLCISLSTRSWAANKTLIFGLL